MSLANPPGMAKQSAGAPSSLAEVFARLPEADARAMLAELDGMDLQALQYDWRFWARPSQLAPAGDWRYWVILAGRGFGKTRTGAEWVRQMVEGESPLQAPKGAPERIALVAQTAWDGREVMIEGESGLLEISPPWCQPRYEVSRRRLTWPNGVTAFLYSADEPDQLRGPQHALAWADELAKWSRAEQAWSNLIMGLRLGRAPRVAVTTTPRPTPLLKALVENPAARVTRGATVENRSNLSPAFLGEVQRLYGGTRIGRQELEGHLLLDVPGALFDRDQLDASRVKFGPPLSRVVVAVDPPVSQGPSADACGIIVAGEGPDGHAYVLADRSVQGLGPLGWAKRAVDAFHSFEADRLVAEVNQGGDMVEAVVRQVDPSISYRAVRASRGKMTRAEPVAALYEQGRVHHLGSFAALEDEMCGYTGGKREKSPDRLDALVWAISDLLLRNRAVPRIRCL